MIFGKNKKRFRPQPEALFATVYYTIPRTVRELQQSPQQDLQTENYTIPRTVRELQRLGTMVTHLQYYTIPRTVRELQQRSKRFLGSYYTIPRTVRELQPLAHQSGSSSIIIPYQELLGNYNRHLRCTHFQPIIPYQELLGNYNAALHDVSALNYTIQRTVRELQLSTFFRTDSRLYHTKNC